MRKYSPTFRISHPPTARHHYYRFRKFPIGIQVIGIAVGMAIPPIIQAVNHR